MQSSRGVSAICLIGSICLIFVASVDLHGQSNARQMLVTVLDDDDSPVGGLGPTDFVIREDGNAREVLSVGPAGAGRQIALLVDTSEAATGALFDFRNGLKTFVDGMSEGNEISLITFGGPPRILVQSTTSAVRLADGIEDLFALPGQAAYMLDALDQTLEGFARREVPRPLIVVLTTEGIDYSNRSAHRVLERIDESGAAVYTLSLRVDRNAFATSRVISALELRNQEIERELVLARGPGNSGGRHRDLLVSLAIGRAMQEIVGELRNQYLVVYSRPDSLIPPEEITVNVEQQSLTARGTPLRPE